MAVNSSNEFAKRLFDLAIGGVSLLLISPCLILLLLLAGLERLLFLDPGPLFILEPRVSKGAVFNMVKLNMYQERARRKYMENSEDFRKYGTYAYLQMQDEKLTYVGRIMKKYYLDELGQLINVMTGDMSLVGPRPLPVGFEQNSHPSRMNLKAGIVGFTATRWKNEQKVVPAEADLEYLELYESESVYGLLKIDASIIVAAIRAIRKGKGL